MIYILQRYSIVGTITNGLEIIFYIGLIWVLAKRSYSINEALTFMGIGVLLLIGYILSGRASFFRSFLIIVAAKNMPYKKIVKSFRIAYMIVFATAFLLWLVGISDAGKSRRNAVALGFGHPNVTAQIIMLICLLWISEIGVDLRIKHYVYIEIAAGITFLITGSRASTFVMFVTPFCIEVFKTMLCSKKKDVKAVKLAFCYIQIAFTMFALFSAKYLASSSFLQRLDELFSNRLFLNYYALNQYGIKIFGQNVELMDNSGNVYNNINNTYNWNVTCDCSYIASLVIMGLVPTIIVLIGFVVLMRKAILNGNYIVASVAFLISAYAFCESQMVEIYRFFVYAYIFSYDGLDELNMNFKPKALKRNKTMRGTGNDES